VYENESTLRFRIAWACCFWRGGEAGVLLSGINALLRWKETKLISTGS
jgi:hypothetical protein